MTLTRWPHHRVVAFFSTHIGTALAATTGGRHSGTRKSERRSSVRHHIGGERNLLSSNQVKRDCWFKGNPYFNMISSNSTKSRTTHVLSWCGATRGSRTLCHTEMGMAMPAPMLSTDVGESITVDNGSTDLSRRFSMSSSDDTNSNIMFSTPRSKKAKALIDSDGGMVTSLSKIESQFGMSTTFLDMPDMDDYLQLQQDFIACIVRTKHGCATHPRSIAERERRARNSKRLRSLQDLVPNMDKQTTTSDKDLDYLLISVGE